MFCPKCGVQLVSDATPFCTHCGSPIKASAQAQAVGVAPASAAAHAEAAGIAPAPVPAVAFGNREAGMKIKKEGATLDKAFFGIVRRFGLLIAFLALIITVGALVWGIVLYQTQVHEAIAKPNIDYEKYKQSLRPAPTAQGQATMAAESTPFSSEAPRKTAFERQFDVYVGWIVANGNRYLSPDFTMREEVVRSSCKEMTDRFPADQHDSLTLAFMDQFAMLSGTFADDPANRANLTDPSEKGKRWGNFSSWVVTELQAQIEAENERVQKETAQAAANKVQALQLVGAAGVAFVMFVFFTLMLVLIAIERNTRTVVAKHSPEHTESPVAAV